MCLKKIHIFGQNPRVLAYGFTENCQFGAKPDQNSVFLGRGPHIENRLSITVSYFNFYGFWKISHFCLNSKGVAYGFTKNCQFRGKNWSKLRISWSWPPYYESVIYNGPVYEFICVWKKFTFSVKIHGWAYGVTENCQFGAKTDRNSVFSGRDPHIANRLSIMVPYFIFYGFWKISHFCSKSKGVSLQFYRKLPVWGKNWQKLRISWSWPPYCESVIYNGHVFQFLRILKIFTFLLEIHGC
jgi:intracellular septation protein A